MVSKKKRKNNLIIAWVLAFITSYVLLINNSLEFLRNFGYSPNPTTIGLIMIFTTIGFIGWKYGAGEI